MINSVSDIRRIMCSVVLLLVAKVRSSLFCVLRSSFLEFSFLHAKLVSKQALIAIVPSCLFEVTTIPLASLFFNSIKSYYSQTYR